MKSKMMKSKYSERKRERDRMYYYKNKIRILKNNREKRNILIENSRKYRLKNKDKIREYNEKNKLKKINYQIKYRQTHKEQIKQYYKKHVDKFLMYSIKRLSKIGGISNKSYLEYVCALLNWSKTIRKRDQDKCVICDSIHKLNAHHLFHKAKYPELSLNVNNGITLCKKCHNEVHGNNIRIWNGGEI